MSSPPALDFPASDQDVDMAGTSVPGAPPRDPLFLAGTPSVQGTPLARRMATPMRTPLFARSSSPMIPRSQDSDPLDFPSSPTKTPRNLRGDIHSSLSLTPRRPNRINSDQPQPNINSDPPHPNLSANAPHPSSEPDEIRAIWGTTVNLTETMSLFRDFLRGFKPKYRAAYDRSTPTTRTRARPFASPEEAEKLTYESYLRTMRQTSETNLNLDIVNLLAYPPSKKLHTQLLKYPQEVIPAMDQVLKDCMIDLAEADQTAGMEGMVGKQGEEEMAEILGKVYKVRPFGVQVGNMRGLNPSDTDKLISLNGLLLRTSPLLPDLQTAFFRCQTCNHTLLVPVSRGKITEPPVCPRDVCASPQQSLTLIHNRSHFADRQIWKIQETPDEVPAGQTPHSVEVCVYDELVDLAKPGDRVCVSGIFRSVGVRANPRQRTLKSLFRTFVDAVHVGVMFGSSSSSGEGIGLDKSTRPTSGDRAPGIGDPFSTYDNTGPSANDPTTTNEAQTLMEEKLRALSQNPDIYMLLARSLAPSIYALEDVKKGILLQLFGGTNKNVAKGGGGGAGGPRFRGDINVLMVGDPGVSKSQILQYVHKIAPRGVYASGKGSSAVGLTAYVTRDADTKQLVLESGALVLSDGGVCCIDEFDKMSDTTRSVLHEVMEQQTVSIAKAGIITTLNARTSILAAANPVNSKYDPDLPITRNIDLPPTLISRFDLLYLVLDTVDEDLDRKLARHIVGLYLDDEAQGAGSGTTQRGRDEDEEEHLPLGDLSAYITYARTHITPIISQEASEALVSAYIDLRHPSSSTSTGTTPNSEKQITATTRQLESLIRLSEAHARMRFSDFVQVADVHKASRLMREAIKTSAMDPRTGKIDMGLINSGTGSGQRRLREDMRKELMVLLDNKGGKTKGGMKWTEVVKMLGEQSSVKVDAVEFAEVVRGLENEGVLKVVGEREKRVIRRID